MGGEAEGFEEDVFVVGEGLYYGVEELVRHVVLVHFLGAEEVLVVDNQQAGDLFQHLMRQVVPPILLQVPLIT